MSVKKLFQETHGNKITVFGSENDAKVVHVKNAKKGCFVVFYTNGFGLLCVELWRSALIKNAKRYGFKTEERRKQYVERWIEQEVEIEQRKKERRNQAKQAGRGLEVGDIVSSCWGYDQTNYNYYEVTALIGKTMVELREVAQMREETEWLQGKCAPVAGEYIGEPIRRKAYKGGVKINDVQYASKVEYKNVNGVRIYNASHYTAYH